MLGVFFCCSAVTLVTCVVADVTFSVTNRGDPEPSLAKDPKLTCPRKEKNNINSVKIAKDQSNLHAFLE